MTRDELLVRKRELETLPEDWYVDMDGSHASLPTSDTIEKACTAAERAMSLGILVEEVDPDANGGTCVDLRSEDYAEVHLYFSNGGKASVVAWGQGGFHEPLTEQSWPKIKEWLTPRPSEPET